MARSISGRALIVDLGTRSASVEDIDESWYRLFLGGIGLGVRLLFQHLPPRVDPLSADNVLAFVPSAMGGTLVPSSAKFAVVTKSPLTGFIGDALSSSYWPLALKRAGFDALIVKGESRTPVYLFIDDGHVHFRRADHLMGRNCMETERLIREETGDDRVRVATIGPAGEHLVRYACVVNDYSRQAGRTGPGAVMGSKRLKAIAVRGTSSVGAADIASLERASLELSARAQGPATDKYRILGTPGNVLALNRLAALPTRNFQRSTFDGAETVSGEHAHEHYLSRVVACASCPVACEHIYKVAEGPYAGSKVQVDYETLFALGPLCDIDDFGVVVKAAQVCDELGMDTISAGVTVAWAMECVEKGLLGPSDLQGLDLRFGSAEGLVGALERIGRREGIGNLLAEGTRVAAATLGGGSDHWAINVKGLELPGYEPRSLKTLALGYAVGARGGCHNRSSAYEVDMSGTVDRFSADESRGPMAAEREDFSAVLDSLGICKFMRRCFDDLYSEAASLYTWSTGLQLTAEEVAAAGERVVNLKKLFNLREGWTEKDDWLPARFLKEPLPSGVAKGVRITPEELLTMRSAYYQARGWTPDGVITRHKLRELHLDDIFVPEEVYVEA